MKGDDRVLFMVAGCVLVMAAAAFVLVGVAPPVGSPHPVVAASSPSMAEGTSSTASRPARTGGGAGIAEAAARPGDSGGAAPAAVPAVSRSTGPAGGAGVEWLTASFDLSAAASEAPGTDADLARLEAIIGAAAEGRIASGAQELDLPWDRVLVRETSDGRTVLAAGTFRHYTAWVESLERLDLERLGKLVASLDAGSAPGIEASLHRAVRHLLEVEVPDGPAEMESHVTRWAFADESARQLSPLQKHLLLMGPANARAVQARLHDLEQALGWTDTDARPASDGIGAEIGAETATRILTDRPSPGPSLLASTEIGEPDETALDPAFTE